jgi:hypothetical protein
LFVALSNPKKAGRISENVGVQAHWLNGGEILISLAAAKTSTSLNPVETQIAEEKAANPDAPRSVPEISV